MRIGTYRGEPFTVFDGAWATLREEGRCLYDGHGAMLAKRAIRRRQLRIERQTKAYQEATCASSPR